MDRNSLIGFALMIVLAGGYFWYADSLNKEQQAIKAQADSVAAAQQQKNILTDTLSKLQAGLDSNLVVDSSVAPAFRDQSSSLATLSNQQLTVQFNTKGAAPQIITLDSFKSYDSYIKEEDKQLVFTNSEQNQFNITLPFNGKNIETKDLYYQATATPLSDGGQQLELKADLGSGKAVIYTYILPKGSYMMKAQLRLVGLQQDLAGASSLPLTWITEPLPTEKALKSERLNAQIHYLYADGEHDYFTFQNTSSETLEGPFKWMSVKTHFFNSTIIADQPFINGSFNGVIDANDSSKIVSNTSKLSIPIQSSNDVVFGYSWMMGPNDYHLLKSYDMDFDEMIQLGTGIFFFVKYISKLIVIPLFELLDNNIVSTGIVIMLLTLIIRLLLSFFTYKSYLSTAKMRVLRPQIDELKKKHEGDQQQFGMEQMKLFRSAGVNPLGGCLPMLFQMPFLLAMYYFFPTSIDLRQEKFLWAEDLSAYDSIASWSQHIPVLSSIYGNHISLFTILMTVTSLLLALYNKNMTNMGGAGGNDMNMAMLKWMPFVMPILFLGWFNNFAAGLTFYYAFSNILSLVQQVVIQKFMIDENKILANMEKKKSEPQKQSKWQQRLEEMQKMQAERMKQQQNRK